MPLADLVGNAAARELLLRAIERGALPHALLFHGPRGVGKLAAGEALAQALLCSDPTPDACGRCRSCERVPRRMHPDLVYLEREEDAHAIKIEAAREIVHLARLKPYEARAKVVLVPEAERLSEESSNTLLKTLEEPPPATYFVLVTTSREAVLATIRSRCQAVRFAPLARAEVERLLLAGEGMAPAEAARRAQIAGGSLSDAAELDLEAHDARRASALALLAELAQGKLLPATADRVVALAEEIARKDEVEELLLDTLRPLARDLMVLAGGGQPGTLVDAEGLESLEPLARTLGIGGASALLGDLERAEGDLRLNANKKLLVESILLGVFTRAAEARPPAPAPPGRPGGRRRSA